MRIFSRFALLLFVLGCSSPESPKLIPNPVMQKAINEKKTAEANNKVDILFVIDNSGSMGSYQKNLSQNIDQFVNMFFNTATIDYHIGVVSTDADTYYVGKKNCCGRLIGDPTYIDKATPNGAELLSERMLVGVNGSATEQSFEPVKLALTEPNLSGFNAGFFRPKAYLAIIFITDAEDQSAISAKDFFDFLVKLKGDPKKVLSYGALIPSFFGASGNCVRDTGEPFKIEEFIGLTTTKMEDQIYNLCDPDFGEQLAKVAKIISDSVDKAILLDQPPIEETIIVTYGTQVIPRHERTGWSFDATTNSIHLGKDVVLDPKQPEGTAIKVDYEPTSYLPKFK